MLQNADTGHLRSRGRTSICRPTLLNMGNRPRTAPYGPGGGRVATMPRTRYARDYFPSSHLQVLAVAAVLIRRCVPNSDPHFGTRADMEARFHDIKDGDKVDRAEAKLCKTPLCWIEHGLGGRRCVCLIESLENIYANDHSVRDDLVEFFLFLDVKLNRAIMPARTDGVADPDKVVMALAYDHEKDIEQGSDWKYRSVIAFLPGMGVFYCARERYKGNNVKTLLNTLIPLDMSWLQITKGNDNLLKFGSDGYV